jgi:CubicO group peptidase (beta-lactamase class C family)
MADQLPEQTPEPTSRRRPLTPDEVEVVRRAAEYAGTWVALRRITLQVPGVQLAVAVAGEVLVEQAHGSARLPGTDGPDDEGEPLRTDHLFRIASHSKTFTATAVMQLVEQGRLRLDDTVAEHVPELADAAVGDRTVAELLAHGGGVVRDTHDSDFWTLDRPFPDRDALLAAARDRADVLPANEQFKYSNIGYGLVGLVIEAVTGRSWAEHLREAVLEPLGLQRTGPELDPERLSEYATGYSPRVLGDRTPIDTIDTGALASATGFFSTAGDLVRYAAAHVLGDTTLLTDASKRRLHRAQWAVPGGDEHYGLGFGRQTVGERTLVGHGGGFPGHITRTVLDPADGLTVVVLTNAIDGPAQELATGVVKIVDAALAAHREGTDDDGHDLSVFEGRWAGLWGVSDLVDLGGRLRAIVPDQADPTAGIAALEVVDATTARFTETGGYASPGETVVAHREGGRTAWLRYAGGRRRPLEEQQAWLAGRPRVTAPR